MLIGFGRNGEGGNDSTALASAGCERAFIYDALFELRERLGQLIDFARHGDIVVVVDLDRFGVALHEVLDAIMLLDNNGVGLKVEKHGIVPGTGLGDSFGAACKILRNIEANRRHAADVHRRRGRPNVLDPDTQAKALQLLSGKASVLEVARVLRVSPATIYRYFPKRSNRAIAKSEKV